MNKDFKRVLTMICVGAIGGFINGFFGGGGGMVIVPMLVKFLKMPQKNAQATCIAIILAVSIVSGFFYLMSTSINFITLSYVTLGVLVGGIIGAFLLKKINNKALSLIFSFIMLFAGIKMLF